MASWFHANSCSYCLHLVVSHQPASSVSTCWISILFSSFIFASLHRIFYFCLSTIYKPFSLFCLFLAYPLKANLSFLTHSLNLSSLTFLMSPLASSFWFHFSPSPAAFFFFPLAVTQQWRE